MMDDLALGTRRQSLVQAAEATIQKLGQEQGEALRNQQNPDAYAEATNTTLIAVAQEFFGAQVPKMEAQYVVQQRRRKELLEHRKELKESITTAPDSSPELLEF